MEDIKNKNYAIITQEPKVRIQYNALKIKPILNKREIKLITENLKPLLVKMYVKRMKPFTSEPVDQIESDGAIIFETRIRKFDPSKADKKYVKNKPTISQDKTLLKNFKSFFLRFIGAVVAEQKANLKNKKITTLSKQSIFDSDMDNILLENQESSESLNRFDELLVTQPLSFKKFFYFKHGYILTIKGNSNCLTKMAQIPTPVELYINFQSRYEEFLHLADDIEYEITSKYSEVPTNNDSYFLIIQQKELLKAQLKQYKLVKLKRPKK